VVVNATTCPDEAAIRARLNSAAREFVGNGKGMTGGADKEISLIIDGEALEMALRPGTASHLLSFAKLYLAVICNRVSPAQKAEMVSSCGTIFPRCGRWPFATAPTTWP
jgi:hypothetical protein